VLNRVKTGESGAILVFTALLLLVLIGFAALAVDLGNAWSTNRQGQSAADISATSGLFAIPRTFSDVPGAPAPRVTTAVQTEVDDLLSVNAPGATASIAISADALDLTVDITVDSNNSFGRALGAGPAITITNTASGHIEIQPFDALRPFGFFNLADQPYQCLDVGVPAANRPRVCDGTFEASNGLRVDMLRMFGLDPPDCSDRTVTNLQSGVDHLVDTDSVAGPRAEADACLYGHVLTMPNESGTYFPTTGQLTSGLVSGGGPLAGSPAPLWDWLVPGLDPNGVCDSSTYALEPDLEGRTLRMRLCLRSGGAAFQSGLISSPRFSWAIRTSGAIGTRPYNELTLMFLNTTVSDDPTLSPEDAQQLGPPVSGNVAAITMYELQESYLSSSDRAALRPPMGTDYLEFSLTD
jgi:hypothetical protein